MHVLSTGKLSNLNFNGTLAKHGAHGIKHEFGNGAFTRVVSHLLEIQLNSFVGLVVRTGLLALFRCRKMG